MERLSGDDLTDDLVEAIHELRLALKEERRRLDVCLADRAMYERWNAQLRMALHAMIIDGSEECQMKAARALIGVV